MKDHSFSYSQLSTALRCNKLWQYLFIDKLGQESSMDMDFGTSLHCGLNEVLEGGSGDSFMSCWESYDHSTWAKKGRYSYQELAEMGQTFISRFKRLHAPHLKLTYGEKRLHGFSPNGVRLEGTPDFVGVYRGLTTVEDFKTASSRYPEGKAAASDQLYLYAYLVQQAYGIKVEQLGYRVFIKAKEPSIQMQHMPLDQEILAQRILNIEAHCKKLSQNESNLPNYNACFDYNRPCIYFSLCHNKLKLEAI